MPKTDIFFGYPGRFNKRTVKYPGRQNKLDEDRYRRMLSS